MENRDSLTNTILGEESYEHGIRPLMFSISRIWWKRAAEGLQRMADGEWWNEIRKE